eukprot:394666_1
MRPAFACAVDKTGARACVDYNVTVKNPDKIDDSLLDDANSILEASKSAQDAGSILQSALALGQAIQMSTSASANGTTSNKAAEVAESAVTSLLDVVNQEVSSDASSSSVD